jgi:hypothetical protein
MGQDTIVKIVAAIVIGVVVIGIAIYIANNSNSSMKKQLDAANTANGNLGTEIASLAQ